MNDAPIVVGIDGSERSHAIVSWGIKEARQRNARLLVVICQPAHAQVRSLGAGPGFHGTDPVKIDLLREQANRIIEDARPRDAADGHDVHIEVDAFAGSPAERLVALSRTAQLLVIGSRGSGNRSQGLFGSVATAVTRNAKCPVVVIP
ncbi:MAG TPA: universal stress protein [Streptosporangiales bacterium]